MPHHRTTRKPLHISPPPFKPSRLSIPPSPFSPCTPLTPAPFPATRPHHKPQPVGRHPQRASDAPPSPMSWVWTCHQCHRNYQLGVTRRCLDDGHQFCSGTTTVKAWRGPSVAMRVKKHKACASEFDYQGWKAWGRWRRGGSRNAAVHTGSPTNAPWPGGVEQYSTCGVEKDCWNTCDYPSECRWGKRFGVHTPVDVSFPAIDAGAVSVNQNMEGVLRAETGQRGTASMDAERHGLWSALAASTERRKSGRASSPLATVAEEPELDVASVAPDKNRSGDVVMTTIDPTLRAKSSDPPSPTDFKSPIASAGSTAVDSLKALIKKTKHAKSSGPLDTHGEARNAVPMLTVRRADPEALLEGSAPLERVASRDGGYHSTPDAG